MANDHKNNSTDGRRWRKRRVLKWISLICAVALMIAFVLSIWGYVGYRAGSWDVGCGHGLFIIASDFGLFRKGLSVGIENAELDSWFYLEDGVLAVPLWFPILLAAILTACIWYADRKHPLGLCAKCNYDLRGLTSDRCPECGSPIRTES